MLTTQIWKCFGWKSLSENRRWLLVVSTGLQVHQLNSGQHWKTSPRKSRVGDSFTRRPQCKLNRQVRQSVQTHQFTLPLTPASRNCSEANQSNWEVSKMHWSHTHKHFLFDESNGDACRFHRPLFGGIILAMCGQRIPSQQYPNSLQTPMVDEHFRFEAEWRIAKADKPFWNNERAWQYVERLEG